MSSKYFGIVQLNQGTSDYNIKKQIQLSWDNVPLNRSKLGIWKFYMPNGANMQMFLSVFDNCPT